LLLLSADKGTSCEADLVSKADPSIVLHGGCFSMMVNYHAIGEYVRNLGGQVLHVPHRHTWLNACAYLLGQHPTNYLETAQAFHEAIEQWGPDEFLMLKLEIEKICHTLNLEQLLAYLRLCGWDSRSFLVCFPLLLEKVETSSLVQRQELYQVAQQVWNAYYPIDEKQDLAYALAVLLYNLGYYAEALNYFQISLQRYGPHENTLSNMAKCRAALQLETR
jgi:tetratricopeptide (TPR) repeat protein